MSQQATAENPVDQDSDTITEEKFEEIRQKILNADLAGLEEEELVDNCVKNPHLLLLAQDRYEALGERHPQIWAMRVQARAEIYASHPESKNDPLRVWREAFDEILSKKRSAGIDHLNVLNLVMFALGDESFAPYASTVKEEFTDYAYDFCNKVKAKWGTENALLAAKNFIDIAPKGHPLSTPIMEQYELRTLIDEAMDEVREHEGESESQWDKFQKALLATTIGEIAPTGSKIKREALELSWGRQSRDQHMAIDWIKFHKASEGLRPANKKVLTGRFDKKRGHIINVIIGEMEDWAKAVASDPSLKDLAEIALKSTLKKVKYKYEGLKKKKNPITYDYKKDEAASFQDPRTHVAAYALLACNLMVEALQAKKEDPYTDQGIRKGHPILNQYAEFINEVAGDLLVDGRFHDAEMLTAKALVTASRRIGAAEEFDLHLKYDESIAQGRIYNGFALGKIIEVQQMRERDRKVFGDMPVQSAIEKVFGIKTAITAFLIDMNGADNIAHAAENTFVTDTMKSGYAPIPADGKTAQAMKEAVRQSCRNIADFIAKSLDHAIDVVRLDETRGIRTIDPQTPLDMALSAYTIADKKWAGRDDMRDRIVEQALLLNKKNPDEGRDWFVKKIKTLEEENDPLAQKLAAKFFTQPKTITDEFNRLVKDLGVMKHELDQPFKMSMKGPLGNRRLSYGPHMILSLDAKEVLNSVFSKLANAQSMEGPLYEAKTKSSLREIFDVIRMAREDLQEKRTLQNHTKKPSAPAGFVPRT